MSSADVFRGSNADECTSLYATKYKDLKGPLVVTFIFFLAVYVALPKQVCSLTRSLEAFATQ